MNKELILEALTVARDAMDMSDPCLPAGSSTETVVRAAVTQVDEAIAHIETMSKMVSPEEAELKELRDYKRTAAALMTQGSAKINDLIEQKTLLRTALVEARSAQDYAVSYGHLPEAREDVVAAFEHADMLREEALQKVPA